MPPKMKQNQQKKFWFRAEVRVEKSLQIDFKAVVNWAEEREWKMNFLLVLVKPHTV